MSCWVALKTLGRLAGAMTAICLDEVGCRCRREVSQIDGAGGGWSELREQVKRDAFWWVRKLQADFALGKKVWTFCLPR